MSRKSGATSPCDRIRYPTQCPATVDLPRGDGVAELTFGAADGHTARIHLYEKAPCRILFPKTHRGELPTAVLLTTSGGLTGGDRLRIALTTRTGASAVATSQAAEKIYRSNGPPCVIQTTIHADSSSWFEWIPQEMIVFDGCRVRRSTTIETEHGAEVLAGELIVFGRLAHGEALWNGSLWDRWTILRNGRPAWLDTLVLDDAQHEALDHAAGFDGARAMATMVYVADQASSRVATARALLESCTVRWGVTCVNDVLITRFLAPEPHQLRREYKRFWAAFRAAVANLPPQVPRVWEC